MALIYLNFRERSENFHFQVRAALLTRGRGLFLSVRLSRWSLIPLSFLSKIFHLLFQQIEISTYSCQKISQSVSQSIYYLVCLSIKTSTRGKVWQNLIRNLENCENWRGKGALWVGGQKIFIFRGVALLWGWYPSAHYHVSLLTGSLSVLVKTFCFHELEY